MYHLYKSENRRSRAVIKEYTCIKFDAQKDEEQKLLDF